MAQPRAVPLPTHEAAEPNPPKIAWSSIVTSTPNLEKLRLLCHSQKELKKEGYVIKPLNTDQIESKARCMRCGKRPSHRVRPKAKIADHINENKKRATDLANVNTKDTINDETSGTSTSVSGKKARAQCSYHTGTVRNKAFTCCGRHVSAEGCIEAQKHTMPQPDDHLLHEYWQYHPTPPVPTQLAAPANRNSAPSTCGSRRQGHKRGRQQGQAPIIDPLTRGHNHAQQHHNNPHRFHAIALDCEMGVAATGDSELIRLTAVDFFSGSVLIDNLVAPSVRMTHYNTRYSGVTARDMREAVKAHTAILGRDRAREALFRLVGPDTVVVVHGGSGDFSVLRWIHPLVVDTFILDGYTGVKTKGGRSLQNLCKVKLGIAVQVSGPQSHGGGDEAQGQSQNSRRRKGHDSYEDAMAARELLVHWAKSIPDA